MAGGCRGQWVGGSSGDIWVMQNMKDVREYEYRVTPNRHRRCDAELDHDNIELVLGSYNRRLTQN